MPKDANGRLFSGSHYYFARDPNGPIEVKLICPHCKVPTFFNLAQDAVAAVVLDRKCKCARRWRIRISPGAREVRFEKWEIDEDDKLLRL